MSERRHASDFWSRRKAAVQAEAAQEAAAQQLDTPDAEAAEAETHQAPERDDATLLAELGLPDPDLLQPGDDVSGFMARAVPSHLRRRALRKLWVSNPVLANVDGLVDYAEDYTDAATVIPDLRTAYQVGKGMLRHIEAVAARAEQGAEEHAEEQGSADQDVASECPATTMRGEKTPALAPPKTGPEPVEELIPVEDAESLPMHAEAAQIPVPAPPRHMRFDYAEEAQS